MFVPDKAASFSYLRKQTVGVDTVISTPFGRRHLLYADYIASGRCLRFVEDMIGRFQHLYANTHTEDDITGRMMSLLLKGADESIKQSVNAGPRHRIVACGTGATSAIYRLQQILGIALPPATRIRLGEYCKTTMPERQNLPFMDAIAQQQPVVFVGPYEHHSNEVSWRCGLASVVEVGMDETGGVSLAHLSQLLEDPQYRGRMRFGSFSAASNVTGRLTPVHDVARLLHRHNVPAFFDFAAAAPYTQIDMNPPRDPDGGDPSLDAVFISPHKFLGGPESSGVLIFDEGLYTANLPPSVAGGGTVSYVNALEEDFYTDIEEREKAGTPGTLQIVRAALAFAVKDRITAERIRERESELLKRAFARWQNNPNLEILGDPDPESRLAIVSFNVKAPGGTYLHPKYVTTLLNDLFGIQSRAGCACAGPYGHRLLNIGLERSHKYRSAIGSGHHGIKPGWCRIGFHYTMDDAEANFLIDAVEFVAEHGACFIDQYEFDLASGHWTHKETRPLDAGTLAEEAWRNRTQRDRHYPAFARKWLYGSYLRTAKRLALELKRRPRAPRRTLPAELQELQFFALNSAG